MFESLSLVVISGSVAKLRARNKMKFVDSECHWTLRVASKVDLSTIGAERSSGYRLGVLK